MLKRAAVIIFVACICVNAGARTLDIRPHRQNTLVWCWGASAAMVVEYLTGRRIEDCQVLTEYARENMGIQNCCANPMSCLRGGMPGEIERILETVYRLETNTSPSPLSFDAIVENIDAGRPMIAWLWRTTNSAHVVVLAGYDPPGSIVVLDPMLGRVVVPYQTLRANWQTGRWRETIVISNPDAPNKEEQKEARKDACEEKADDASVSCYARCRYSRDPDKCFDRCDKSLDRRKESCERRFGSK